MTPEERFKEYLDKEGLKQRNVAEKLGQSVTYFNKVLNGKVNFTHEMLVQIAKEFPKLDMNWLFKGGESPEMTHPRVSESVDTYGNPLNLVNDIEEKVKILKSLLTQE